MQEASCLLKDLHLGRADNLFPVYTEMLMPSERKWSCDKRIIKDGDNFRYRAKMLDWIEIVFI